MLHSTGIGSLAIGNSIHDQAYVRLMSTQPMTVTPEKGLTGGCLYRYSGDIDALNDNTNIRSRVDMVMITTSAEGSITLVMLVLPSADADTLITELRIVLGDEDVMLPVDETILFTWNPPDRKSKTMLLLVEGESAVSHLVFMI